MQYPLMEATEQAIVNFAKLAFIFFLSSTSSSTSAVDAPERKALPALINNVAMSIIEKNAEPAHTR